MSVVLAVFGVWFLFNIAVVAVMMIRTLPPRELRWSFPIRHLQYATVRPRR
jgi:hypothetical protein